MSVSSETETLWCSSRDIGDTQPLYSQSELRINRVSSETKTHFEDKLFSSVMDYFKKMSFIDDKKRREHSTKNMPALKENSGVFRPGT